MNDFAKDTNVFINDCISRQAAIDAVSDCGICIQRIVDLPSVEPERKKGKWIEYPIVDGTNQCSECGVLRFGESNFCPNCGAEMETKDGKDGLNR